jgi:cell fate (sporulation/competence/biofilm development) regulator YmcA (YheA/YmcA/DUF963 family)
MTNEEIESEAFEWSVDYKPWQTDLAYQEYAAHGYVVGYQRAEGASKKKDVKIKNLAYLIKQYEKNEIEYLKSIKTPRSESKKDKKIKELEGEVSKLKVILSFRNKVERLHDILIDLLEWDTCPDEYKKRIAGVLDLELEVLDIKEDEDDSNDWLDAIDVGIEF